MASINQKLALYSDVYNTDKYASIDYLAAGKLSKSETLSNAVVQLYGNYSDRFPLYLSTKGRKGGIRKITSADTTFQVDIMGKPKKSSAIGKTIYSASDKIGVGRVNFVVWHTDRWFKKGDLVETYKHNKLQVQSDPEEDGNYWKYTYKITGADSNAYVTLAEIAVGQRFALMFQPAGLKNSKGREHRSQSIAKMQNQCAFLRNSYNWIGNLDNKTMIISLPTKNGKTTQYWQEWEMFQLELQQMEQCENYLWYSEFNRTPDGKILDKDPDTNEVMPMGSGLLEQIPNSSTYGILTEEKISRVVRDVMYNSSADKQKNITLYTGLGGMEEFDKAMKKASVALGLNFNLSNKLIDGAANSHGLQYGAYFGSYQQVDGHIVTIKRLPMLDQGARAEAAPKHPISGLPITSYDMYFVDESTIEGAPNIQFVQEAGREDIKKIVAGINSKDTQYVATDEDKSSVEMATSIGIHMYNPTNSFKLICNIS